MMMSILLNYSFFPFFPLLGQRLISSICDASLFGFTIWECYPWVWSVFQLSHYAIFNRTRVLQFPQLVRWPCMVSAGPNYWRNHLSRLDGHISCALSHSMAAEFYGWHSKCLRIPCAILFVTHRTGHLSLDKGNSCMYSYSECILKISVVTPIKLTDFVLLTCIFQQSTGAGLVAAAMISIVPGYISRSVAGSYDNEGIAIFCMLLTYYLWIKAVKTGAILWSTMSALAYFYMVSSWGGYVFLINLIPLHVLALLVTGRFSHRIYVAYSILYCVGTILSMQISFVGFQPVQSSEHMLVSFWLC